MQRYPFWNWCLLSGILATGTILAQETGTISPGSFAQNSPAPPSTPPSADPPATPAAADPPPAPAPAPAPAPVEKGPELFAKTSRINGLLVSILPGNKTAGAASQMNAAAIPSGNTEESTLKFNQPIGPQMEKALGEVRKFMTIRHDGWARGYAIEISFADKYTPKDGPSAAVACALLMEGLYSAEVWDPAFAVTGDLNADGSVQPVGGVPAKIRGALNRKCRLIGIPASNERAVRDYMLAEGPQVLMGINIMALKEFEEAQNLALVKKPAAITNALTAFDRIIQAQIPADRAPTWVKLPAVTAQLKKVVELAPHHLSARLLLDYASGKDKTLSLVGSLEFIDRETGDLLPAVNEAVNNMGQINGIKKDSLGNMVYRLRRARGLMHPETRPLIDSVERFSNTVRTILDNPPRTQTFAVKAQATIQSAATQVQAEYHRLRTNPEITAQMMNE